ncbi:transcription factor Adf-1-like [Maniola hyperantus]|uniref:transcription factor Adf-1-like n=1 Tax=Aphantopus hyperantus TaxID=2795564 RepID=UPI00374A452D
MASPPPKFTSRDVDKLINAMKARPPLYSRTERYAPQHRHKKTTQWREVCRELNSDFDSLSGTDKLEYEREVYKRWRSLRTCFSRELTLQRREKLRGKVKRRKRYEHFEELSFLMPEYEHYFQDDTMNILHFGSDEETAEVAEFEEPRSEDETFHEIKSETELENYSETDIFMDSDPVHIEPKRERDTLDFTREKRERDTLEDTRREKKEESDSDKLFILSLVPSFRRITPKKKLAAKIELMKVLQSFQDDTY